MGTLKIPHKIIDNLGMCSEKSTFHNVLKEGDVLKKLRCLYSERNVVFKRTKHYEYPWYVPSSTMSRPHWIMVRIIINPPVTSSCWLYWWNHLIIPAMVTYEVSNHRSWRRIVGEHITAQRTLCLGTGRLRAN
jgi:hypothetical protein